MSATRIRLRRGTAAGWVTKNPVLALGELGLEKDTGRIKFGDGATAWNSLAYYSTTTLHGAGSPEGSVTAPVGTEYTDDNATNGAIKWIKATGTGNTGWKVTYGDTGWRNVAPLASGLSGAFRLRRMNQVVELVAVASAVVNDGSAASPAMLANLGTGFGPGSAFYDLYGNATPIKLAEVQPGAVVYLWSSTAGNQSIHLTWTTTDPWPAALPGTPA